MNIDRALILSIILIAALGAVSYANSLAGDFIWDDNDFVRDNLHIRSWRTLPKVFTTNLTAGAGKRGSAYRPLLSISYTVDHALWKFDTRGYHITSALFHIFAALGLCRFIYVLFGDRRLAFLTAALFVVHPVHTEAVSYISGRSDPMAALFMLLAFAFYIRGRGILAPTLFALALLSRENSLILPLLVLLYHYTFRVEFKLRRFAPILSVALGYVFLRVVLLRGLPAYAPHDTTLLQRIPGFFVALVNYVKVLVLPVGLHMEYGGGPFRMSDPMALAGLSIFIIALVFLFKKRDADRISFFSLSWFFAALLPVANLYPINAYMAEHWLYFPSIGLFLLAAKGLVRLYETKGLKKAAPAIIIVIVASSAFLTIRQNGYWRMPVTFYERTLEFAPGSARLYNNLGDLKRASGDNEGAIILFKKALAIDADYADPYNNLAIAYGAVGEDDLALASYRKAIGLRPGFAKYHYNLGVFYTNAGRYGDAIISYKRAVELNPDFAEAYYNLAVIYEAAVDRGQEEALEFYKKAEELFGD